MWFSSSLNKKQRSPAPHRRTTFRPTLEALEGRWLPSSGSTVLTVTSILDSVTKKGPLPGSLRYEIAQAEQSTGTDTIVFNLAKSDQDYTGHWTIQLTQNLLYINRSLNIQGPGAGQLAISGGPSGAEVFEVGGGYVQVSLSGLCIENGGNAVGVPITYGAGIGNYGTLTVSGCRLTNNYASFQGGGIYNAGTLTVSGCALDGNGAVAVDGGTAYGGGIYNAGTLTVSNSTLSFNSANYGGAIWNVGSLTVSGSTFVHNDIDGGGYTDGGGNTFVTSAPQINSSPPAPPR
jgi:hypothetical protein